MYFLVQSAERTNSNHTQGAMSIPGAHTLAFKYHLSLKESGS